MGYFSELHAEGPYRTCGEADEARQYFPEEYAMAIQEHIRRIPMLYPIGSKVRLADYTGDKQIDYYYGQPLEVIEYREILTDWNAPRLPNYSLVAPDGIVITANEYELEAIDGPQAH